MAKAIGVIMGDRIRAGLVCDHHLTGPLHSFPDGDQDESELIETHTVGLITAICQRVRLAADGHQDIAAVGLAMPGIIRNGVVEDSPNLPQLKGARMAELLASELHNHGVQAPVYVLNDADGVAAGLAAQQDKLDQFLRVWTLGVGIGYGRYPFAPGMWEGGHTVVTLDDKENFCGCGGRGHLEGVMGHRAMRLRFLDMEPEEVFEEAHNGNKRCAQFKQLWHRALAAGIANTLHLDGPGKTYLTGFNVRFVDLPMLQEFLGEMVKMSPLQGYSVEVVEDKPETRVIGAAVAAEQACASGAAHP